MLKRRARKRHVLPENGKARVSFTEKLTLTR